MIRLTLFLVVWCNFSLRMHAQTFQIGIALEYKTKTERYSTTGSEVPLIGKISGADANFGILVSIRKKQYGFEAGYYRKEEFYAGWATQELGRYRLISSFHIVPLRFQYHIKVRKVLHRQITISPSAGVLMVSGEKIERGMDEISKTTLGPSNNRTICAINYDRFGQEILFNTDFMLWEGRIQAQYDLSPYLGLFVGFGYAIGNTILGRGRAEYWVNNEPHKEIRTTSMGTNNFWNIGLRLQIPIKDQKKP
jgi:hypothetical protein